MFFKKAKYELSREVYSGEVSYAYKGEIHKGFVFGRPKYVMMSAPIYNIVTGTKVHQIPEHDIDKIEFYFEHIKAKK